MRVVTVLGAIVLGLGLGSAAVLAPLMMGSVGGKAETTQTVPWGSEWGQQATRAAQSLIGRETKPTSAASKSGTTQPPLEVAAQAPAQEARTIDFLAHPGGTNATATVADARIVQNPWKTQVTVSPESSANPKRLTSSKATSDEQRQTLIRDLQIELKRVGCYDGEPNGQWGAASKKAMATFTDRVNASLPYEQPDFILLTLVQGHKGRACGQDCPTGQSLADNGRCTPNSILAQAERSKQTDTGKRDALTAAAAAAVAATTVAAAKLSDTRKSQDRSSIASAWSTTTRQAPVETGSIAAAPARVIRPQPAAGGPLVTVQPPVAVAAAAQSETLPRPASALPGRMAIGAPLPAPADAAPAPAAVKPATRVAAAPANIPPAMAAVDPVTTAQTAPEPTRSERRPQRAPQVRHAPETVTVRRPPPQPRYTAPASQQKVAASTKSRRLIYDLFQNPNRN